MAGGLFSLAKLFGITLRESANDGSDFTNPDADYRRLFLGEDGALHLKDSAGAVTDVGGAGGAVATDAIWDAAGDLVQGTGANTAARLALGTVGQSLVSTGSAAAWGRPGHVGCALYNSGTQSINSASQTALTFDTEEWDTDGFHAGGAPTRITIPTGLGGKYLVKGKVFAPFTAVSSKYLGIILNGNTTPIRREGLTLAADPDTGNIVEMLALAQGDYIELTLEHNNAGAQNVGHGSARRVQNEFQITFLGA